MSELVLDLREADPEFKKKVRKIPGAERLTLCLQCGSCTADCPVARRTGEFRPRVIARLAILGFKELLFSGDLLWLCLGCFNCVEHCPQQVRPTEVIEALRELAIKEGKFHPSIRAKLEPIFKFGRMYEITEFENEVRGDYGLPPVPEVKLNELRMLLALLGVDKLLGIEISGGGERSG